MACWPIGVTVAATIAGCLIGRYPDGLLGAFGLGRLAAGLALHTIAVGGLSGRRDWWRLAICGGRLRSVPAARQPHDHASAPHHRAAAASVCSASQQHELRGASPGPLSDRI